MKLTMPNSLFLIGYEKLKIEDFIKILKKKILLL